MDPPKLSGFAKMHNLAEAVRRRSQAGELLCLEETGRGAEDIFTALVSTPGASTTADIQLIREGEHAYLFSNAHMTRAYAEAAARAAAGNHLRAIAETVRHDAATYPRPTPVETFRRRPYLLSPEEIAAAVARMSVDPEFADIQSARASNGDQFLYSLNHLDKEQAETMAEWLAVGQFDNP